MSSSEDLLYENLEVRKEKKKERKKLRNKKLESVEHQLNNLTTNINKLLNGLEGNTTFKPPVTSTPGPPGVEINSRVDSLLNHIKADDFWSLLNNKLESFDFESPDDIQKLKDFLTDIFPIDFVDRVVASLIVSSIMGRDATALMQKFEIFLDDFAQRNTSEFLKINFSKKDKPGLSRLLNLQGKNLDEVVQPAVLAGQFGTPSERIMILNLVLKMFGQETDIQKEVIERFSSLVSEAEKAAEILRETKLVDYMSQADEVAKGQLSSSFVSCPDISGNKTSSFSPNYLKTILISLGNRIYIRGRSTKPITAYLKAASSAIESLSLNQEASYQLLLSLFGGTTWQLIETRNNLDADLASTWMLIQKTESNIQTEASVRAAIDNALSNPSRNISDHLLYIFDLCTRLFDDQPNHLKRSLAVASAIDFYKTYLHNYYHHHSAAIILEFNRTMRMNISSKGKLEELDIMLGIISTCLSGVLPSVRKRPSAQVFDASAELEHEGGATGFDPQSSDFKCFLCNDEKNLHHFEDCNIFLQMEAGQNICQNCADCECQNNPSTETAEINSVEEIDTYFGHFHEN